MNAETEAETQALPAVVWDIVQLAKTRLQPQKIWLFGSRARGDHRKFSDIDLAFLIDASAEPAWSAFVSAVEDQARSLLSIDLVNLARCEAALRAEILKSGRVLYER